MKSGLSKSVSYQLNKPNELDKPRDCPISAGASRRGECGCRCHNIKIEMEQIPSTCGLTQRCHAAIFKYHQNHTKSGCGLTYHSIARMNVDGNFDDGMQKKISSRVPGAVFRPWPVAKFMPGTILIFYSFRPR